MDFNTAASLHSEYFPFIIIAFYATNYFFIKRLIDKKVEEATFGSIVYTTKKGFESLYRDYGSEWKDKYGHWINKSELIEKLTEASEKDHSRPDDDFLPETPKD